MFAFFRFIAHVVSSLLVTIMMAGVIGGFAVIFVFYHFSKDLPDMSQLAHYDPAIVTRLYASDGKLMAEYATQKRVYVPLSAIPKRVIQAFISAEDKDFYQHTGVDFKAMARAALTNIKNYGQNHSMVGGSTITQQVVKNFLLTPERSLVRKIKEAILAFRISQVYSKNRILELYLNEIYLGQGSYGVAAASINYFNKSLDELTIEEAAFLGAMPKAPANYDPRFYYERAKERRDWVIGRMQEDQYIGADEAQAAAQMPIVVRKRDDADVTRADFFAEEVRRKLAELYGSDVLYKGGLYVKTTLDPILQGYADESLRYALIEYDRRHGYRGSIAKVVNMDDWQNRLLELTKQDIPRFDGERIAAVMSVSAEKAKIGFEDGTTGMLPLSEMKWARKQLTRTSLGPEVNNASDVVAVGDVIIVKPVADKKETFELRQIPEVNGALVAMDPHTGRVLAMAGGYSYGRTEFNRATQAQRQPGSAFKPFVYLTALEAGFTPSTMVLDAPVELTQGAGMPMWRPENYKDEYLGPTTLRRGLEKSRNTMTVRLAQMLGIDPIIQSISRFPIYKQVQRHFAIVLGAQETTLLQLATAYCELANGGKKVTPALIERIDDRYGKTILRRDQRVCSHCLMEEATLVDPVPPIPPDDREVIVDPQADYQIVSLMQGVVERGTATKAKVIGKPLAGKTGTTNDSRDAWFVGFSPDLVAGIYVGFDRPSTLGGKETGGSVALPGFVHFMQRALEKTPAKPFRAPPGIQFIKVDYKTGQPPVYGETMGPIILEAFKTGQSPGEYPSGMNTADVNPEDWQYTPPENVDGYAPVEDLRQRAQWEQRYGLQGQQPESSLPSSWQGLPQRGYAPPPEDRRPVNDPGTGGLY